MNCVPSGSAGLPPGEAEAVRHGLEALAHHAAHHAVDLRGHVVHGVRGYADAPVERVQRGPGQRVETSYVGTISRALPLWNAPSASGRAWSPADGGRSDPRGFRNSVGISQTDRRSGIARRRG